MKNNIECSNCYSTFKPDEAPCNVCREDFEEKEGMNYDAICKNCNYSFGSHRRVDNLCPHTENNTYWREESTHFEPVKTPPSELELLEQVVEKLEGLCVFYDANRRKEIPSVELLYDCVQSQRWISRRIAEINLKSQIVHTPDGPYEANGKTPYSPLNHKREGKADA